MCIYLVTVTSMFSTICKIDKHRFGYFCLFFFFGLFAISWMAPAPYGGSRARGHIRAVAADLRPMPEPQQCGIQAASVT